MVDEDRPHADELDVVGAGIRQHDTRIECVDLDVEVQQGSSLEQTEGPLVGVRHERYGRVRQHQRNTLDAHEGRSDVLFRKQPAVSDEPTDQSGGSDGARVCQAELGDGPPDAAVVTKDEAAGISE